MKSIHPFPLDGMLVHCRGIPSIKFSRYPFPHLRQERHCESEGSKCQTVVNCFIQNTLLGCGHFNQIDQYWQRLTCLQCDKMKKYFLNFVGMNTMEGVVMLASTNRQDILDQVKTQ